MKKYIIKITSSLVLAIMAVACVDNNDNVNLGFSLGENNNDTIYFTAIGGKELVHVNTNESWVATTNAPWITISPANGIGSAGCEIIVDSTLVNETRTASIRFTPSISDVKSVVVNQYGFDKVIIPNDTVIKVDASAGIDDRYFETDIVSNVQYKVDIDFFGDDAWLIPEIPTVEFERGARPRTSKLRVDWKMNTVPAERRAEIKLVSANGESLKDTAIISVLQKAAVKIEDNRAGDSIALIVIKERLNCSSGVWDTSENMQHWKGVKLWEATDSLLPSPAAVGRVRSVEYVMLATEESLPMEVKYLKYLESLSVAYNSNKMLQSLDLGTDVCELQYLRNLRVCSYGLVSLPDEFVKLKNLEVLDLSYNNFNSIPDILTPENFPKLKSISFLGTRRNDNISDLRKKDTVEDGVGLNLNVGTDKALRRLLLWENLEELAFSFCYLEGSIPDFKVGEDGVVAYTQEDVAKWGGDTIKYAAEKQLPKILPNCTTLRLNLNFLTGNLPDWMLYHPRFMEWIPKSLIFTQQERGMEKAVDSNGNPVGFDNEPTSFEYYYEAYPLMRDKYEIKEEITNE